MEGGYTVAQLLALANNALSGKYVPSGGDPSLGDLASALGTINEAFDECRLLIEFTSPSVSSSSPNPGPNQNANTSTNTSANNSTA